YTLSYQCSATLRHSHSFPTRRSSDLAVRTCESVIQKQSHYEKAYPRQLRPSQTNSHGGTHQMMRSQHALNAQRNLLPNLYHALRSEEHTSELQSRGHLVCRLLLEKKK